MHAGVPEGASTVDAFAAVRKAKDNFQALFYVNIHKARAKPETGADQHGALRVA